MAKHAKTPRVRKIQRGRVATPSEYLKAVVTVIGDRAKTMPRNCLIGSNPFETITTCNRIIKSVVAGRHGDTAIVIVDAAILSSVCDALDHAKDEADMLWKSAEAVAKTAA